MKILSTLKSFNIIRKHGHILKVLEDIVKFVNETHEQQKPMVTNIVLLNMRDGTKLTDFVSLWAGIGECNPIERAKHLKAQNNELKRLLTIAKDGNVSKDDKELIEITLRYFD